MTVRGLRIWLGLLSLVLLPLACAPAAPGARTIGEADAGKSVEAKVGETLVVTLEANPTTGYMWEVAPDSAAQLKLRGEPVHNPDSPAAGAGGKTALTFDVVSAGTGKLRLVYRRSFEAGVPPVKTFELGVTVR